MPTVKTPLLSGQEFLLISELVENNVTYADDGNYICKLKAHNGEEEAKEYVHVYG